MRQSHLQLRNEWVRAGKIHHERAFFQDSGEPIRLLNYPYERWRHSVTTMFRVYSAWAEGAGAEDTQSIKRAMQRPTAPALELEG